MKIKIENEYYLIKAQLAGERGRSPLKIEKSCPDSGKNALIVFI